jgi:gluconolactonase
MHRSPWLCCLFVIALFARVVEGRPQQSPPVPDAVVDLRTVAGVEIVQGTWRTAPARIIEVEHRAVGPDLKPSGAANRTNDLAPHAGAADFDDSAWTTVDPTMLEQRRGDGRLSFQWYRFSFIVPDVIGTQPTHGTTIYLELVLDDYAEVWVNGRLPMTVGQSGGSLVKGWNAPNRVLLTRNAQPGERFVIAVLGANGPFSDPPGNYIWMRSATLDVYKPTRAFPFQPVELKVKRLNPAINDLIHTDAVLERVADGFIFAEGPVWVPGSTADDGYLLFSDPNQNVIHRWSPDGEVSIFRTKSGYAGTNIGEYRQPGSNGLALDREGRVTICEHGNRRVTRLEKNGTLTVLADRFDGRRLNSPNDLTYRSDGALYFTDPYFGLPQLEKDPSKELAFSGVFCLINGTLKLASTDLRGPNGLAFSPDEKHLYIANWDEAKKIVMRYDVLPDGMLTNGVVFFDMTLAAGEEALDGIKVDHHGNLFVSGPGGVWVIAPDGTHLGTLVGPELAANMAWSGEDCSVLYLTARTSLYRLRLRP